jgi:hypothetical protein
VLLRGWSAVHGASYSVLPSGYEKISVIGQLIPAHRRFNNSSLFPCEKALTQKRPENEALASMICELNK